MDCERKALWHKVEGCLVDCNFPRAEEGSHPPEVKARDIARIHTLEQARMEPVMFVAAKRGSGKIELQAQPKRLGLESFCQAQMRMYLHAPDRRGDLAEGANPPQLSSPLCSAGSAGWQAAGWRGAMGIAQIPLGSDAWERKARGSVKTDHLPLRVRGRSPQPSAETHPRGFRRGGA